MLFSTCVHKFTANFGNYPKGEEFAVLFAVLGNGIFNSKGESWAFQRRKAHGLLCDGRLPPLPRAPSASSMTALCRSGFVAAGVVVNMQDVFMRLKFDLMAMFMFSVDHSCLAADFPSSHESPLPRPWRCCFVLPAHDTHHVAKDPDLPKHRPPQEDDQAQQVLDASIAEFVSLRSLCVYRKGKITSDSPRSALGQRI
ncbi:hypothetical protein QYE76_044512 [Lolium multiflorum]|uniref:Uncharacterized protein n=1 Tax=Lolium multiflorum TaxID=4521 RepID=A0AAD8TIY4_LOLMU|nr:hypothetical protein QYE76_044512 [Lolium multiflorum]